MITGFVAEFTRTHKYTDDEPHSEGGVEVPSLQRTTTTALTVKTMDKIMLN